MRRLHLIHLHDEADQLLTEIARAQHMARSEVVESAICMYVLSAGPDCDTLVGLETMAEDVYNVSHGFYDGPLYGDYRGRAEDKLLQLASSQARILLSDRDVTKYVFGEHTIDYSVLEEEEPI